MHRNRSNQSEASILTASVVVIPKISILVGTVDQSMANILHINIQYKNLLYNTNRQQHEQIELPESNKYLSATLAGWCSPMQKEKLN